MKELNFLDDLIRCFEKLPGVGKKTATRYAYYVIEKYSLNDIEEVSNILIDTFKTVHKCPICGMFTTKEVCDICSDKDRNKKEILILKDPKDLISMEKTGQYNGKYHILGGLISSLNGFGPEHLNLEKIEERIKEDGVQEVIIALPLTPEGDITSMFIERVLNKHNIIISRIGYGLPAGSDLEYADELTIKRALEYRVKKQ